MKRTIIVAVLALTSIVALVVVLADQSVQSIRPLDIRPAVPTQRLTDQQAQFCRIVATSPVGISPKLRVALRHRTIENLLTLSIMAETAPTDASFKAMQKLDSTVLYRRPVVSMAWANEVFTVEQTIKEVCNVTTT